MMMRRNGSNSDVNNNNNNNSDQSDQPLLFNNQASIQESDDDIAVSILSYNNERPKQEPSSQLRTFYNITKCFVGAASLELPWAIMKAGWLGGIIGILILCAMSNFTLHILPKCGHLVADLKTPTYPQIGYAAYGVYGKVAAWFGLIAMTLGVCGSYVVFIGTSMSCVLKPHMSFFTPTTCIILVMPIIILLSWFRSYKYLSPVSVLGIIALVFSLFVSFIDASKHHSISNISDYPTFRVDSYPLFIGNAAFLYLIHSVILPTEQGMNRPKEYGKALNTSMVFVTIINLLYCVPVYLLLYNPHASDPDNTVDGNVLNDIVEHHFKLAVRVLLSLDLFCTIALFLFPMSESIEAAMFDVSTFGTFYTEMRRNLLRGFLIVTITIVAYCIPDFSVLTGLTGGFGNTVVGLILPCLFYYKLQDRRAYWVDTSSNWKKRLELYACVFVGFAGVGVMYLSTNAFTHAIIKGAKPSKC